MKSIADDIRAHHHGSIFLIVDACYAGGIMKWNSDFEYEKEDEYGLGDMEDKETRRALIRDFVTLAGRDKVVVLTSAREKDSAYNTVFSGVFLRGLQGDADGYDKCERDNQISLEEIVSYTIDQVKEVSQGRQVPMVSANFKYLRKTVINTLPLK